MQYSKKFIIVIAFVCGLAVTAMEIAASRLVAPYVGSSAIVWTNVIGVVLAVLSLGYYLGGNLAEKNPDVKVLLWLIFGTGIFFLLVPLFAQDLMSSVLAVVSYKHPFAQILFGSAVMTGLLFGPPLVVLGMANPFLIKVYASFQSEKVGNAAGSISAASTIGSIIGTFIPTLWLIPQIGTKRTIIAFAVVLILLGLAGIRSVKVRLLAIVLIIAAALNPLLASVRRTPGVAYETETQYQYVRIVQDGEFRYISFNEEHGAQSAYNPHQIMTGYYYDYYPLLPYFQAAGPKRILLIGLAGAAISREFKYFFGDNAEVDAVELDPKVIDVSKQFFDLSSQRINVINEDGRTYLAHTDRRYDLIIVDAYQNAMYIPWTMTTAEFWSLAKRGLSPGGILALNVNISSANALVRAIANTQSLSFLNVYQSHVGYNYMITASDVPLDFSSLPKKIGQPDFKGLAEKLALGTKRVTFDRNERILTDDRAPVEFLAKIY